MKIIRLLVIAILIIPVVCVHSMLSMADPPDGGSAHGSNSWIHEAWKGKDALYSELGRRVSAEASSTTKPDTLLAHYAAIAESRPSDCTAQYSWAVATYTAVPRLKNNELRVATVQSVREGFSRAPDPRAYHYERMHFLLESMSSDRSPEYVKVGNRLLSVNGDDPDVVAATGAFYEPYDTDRALSLLKDAIRLAPKRPYTYRTLGICYDALYMEGGFKEASYGHLAIAFFEKFLALAPHDNANSNEALGFIQDINIELRANNEENSNH